MHEILTLQFGQQANYVGTHYWNTQESYFTYSGQEDSIVDHDRSFRPGVGADGQETYTPRTLIYDLKGAFGTLRRENALYGLQHGESVQAEGWSRAAIPLRLPPIIPSPYQTALDEGSAPPRLTPDSVRFWSDYNHLFYHPRSIVQLSDYEVNSSLMPFERYSTGEELFTTLDREHDLLDRDLRPFLEECDQLQGIQILSGIDDAWGGFAARYLERVSDELGKGCRWVFGLKDGKRVPRERQMLQLANTAQSIYALNSPASMHIPLTSLPSALPTYVNMDAASKWETSALQTALMESVTLPARLKSADSASASFGTLESTLSNDGNRRLVASGLSIEDPENLHVEAGSAEQDMRMTNGLTNGAQHIPDSSLDVQLLPAFPSDPSSASRRRTHTFANMASLRGAWETPDEIRARNAESRDRFAEGPRSSTYQTALLFAALSSYPSIFRFPRRMEKFAVKTSLSTSTAVASGVRDLESFARRVVGIDEREALCDGLATMAEEYEEGWSDDEDGDEDE
nr:protein dml1 [Quercus suber]